MLPSEIGRVHVSKHQPGRSEVPKQTENIYSIIAFQELRARDPHIVQALQTSSTPLSDQ